MRGRIIAIDGPSGSGKSTLASRLAEELGLTYLNTGMMYRALTSRALRTKTDPDDGPELARLAASMKFDIDVSRTPPCITIDGRLPDEGFTSPEVELRVSQVSRHAEVRAVLRDEQRRLGQQGAVIEGRDIGSVVFPHADAKIFLLAALDERAVRRTREREKPAAVQPTQAIADAMSMRDAEDANLNPFVPAEDAVAIDTTGLSADEVFEEALNAIERKLAHER